MTDTPANPQTTAFAAAVPKLETAFRDAIARAMTPDMTPALMLGFFQVVVGYARNIRAFRKAAGMPLGLPEELTLLLGEVHLYAQSRLYDPALSAPQALRLHRSANALGRAVLQSLPPPEKKSKPAPNPLARRKPPAASSRPPEMDFPAMLADPAMAAALRQAAGGPVAGTQGKSAFG